MYLKYVLGFYLFFLFVSIFVIVLCYFVMFYLNVQDCQNIPISTYIEMLLDVT